MFANDKPKRDRKTQTIFIIFKLIMSVKVKYHLFEGNNNVIKALAVSDRHVAISSGIEEDWLALFRYTIDHTSNEPITFEKCPTPTLSRRAISLLAFSPDGLFLASAFDRLTIWDVVMDSNELKKSQEYQDHSLEITALVWAPDSTRVATCSLDAKVVITNVRSKQKLKEIDCGNKAVGIAWDPFDKYLACLRFDNKVIVWKICNWEQFAQVSLNFPNSTVEKITSKREDRKIGWSPDFRYLVVPSMDDKVVPIVCVLDRHAEFKVTKNYLGPFSSVNCVRFSPKLFKIGGADDQQVASVFGMGDNDGNISVWHLANKTPTKPICLFKNIHGELIEDICWSQDGSTLMATAMKKYIIVAVFDVNQVYGKMLNNDEVQRTLEDIYGGVRQVTYQTQEINIRTYQPQSQTSNAMIEELPLPSKPSATPTPQTQSQAVPEQQKQTFTEQQIVVQNGKKRIIPKFQVAVSQQEQLQQSQVIQKPLQSHMTQPFQSSTVFYSSLLKLSAPLPQQYSFTMPDKTTLLFEGNRLGLNQNTLVRCIRGTEVKWADQLEGQLVHVACNNDLIVFYTERSYIYVNDRFGCRQFAPIIMPSICKLHLSDKNDLFVIQENGDFKVLSLMSKRVLLEGDMKNLIVAMLDFSKKKQKTDQLQIYDGLVRANIVYDQNGNCIPQVYFKTNTLFSYNQTLGEWTKFQQFEVNQQEQNESTDKIAASLKQKQQSDTFFAKLVLDNTAFQKQETLTDLQQVSQLEEQIMVLFGQDDAKPYVNVIYQYIKKLCDTLPMNQEKLHNLLMRLLIQNTSPQVEYLERCNVDKQDLIKNITYILNQYPRAKSFRDLIE